MSKVRHVLAPRLQRELWAYPNRWVAITYDHLIAVGDSVTEVFQKARAAGVEVPIIYWVPDPKVSYYYPVISSSPLAAGPAS